jgi:hydroxyethylthiazole kinase
MTQDSISIRTTFDTLSLVRERAPLVQNITNYVVMTVSANVLLALGASPAMVHASEEAADFTAIASSLVINIGTLSPAWVDAMRHSAKKAVELGKPWVLDPVGCGATPYRTGVAVELSKLKPTIIRGNASEILSLAGAAAVGGKGVDSTASSDAALSAAAALAKRSGAVVVVTGAIDYATDGSALIAVETGDVLMSRSTGIGCALSATTAAFAAVATPLQAAVAALAVYGAAGKQAASKCRGPGHLPAELCDALFALDADSLARLSNISHRPLA